MGYHTDFEGKFKIEPELPQHATDYLKLFCSTRRMARSFDRNVHGVEGEFFVGGSGFGGQDKDESIINYNLPPSTQPCLWCQWLVSDCGSFIEWDEGEKFYDYVEWISYMINVFFEPNGHKLNGEVSWQGEDPGDSGIIFINNNIVSVKDEIVISPSEPKSKFLWESAKRISIDS